MNRLPRMLVAALGALLLASCLQDDVTPASTQYRTAVHQVMTRYHVPGALVSVRVPGDPRWSEAFGVGDRAAGTPIDPASFFPIRSITKSYTVTVILQLVRDRLARLDDKLDQYVPGFPNGDRITLADLAGMQSGIGDYTENATFRKLFGEDLARTFTEPQLAGYGREESPQFEPGAQYQYSNTNTVLLGMIVERITGQPLGDALQSRILTPLGMRGTSYPLTVPLPAPHPTPYDVDVTNGALAGLPLISPTSLAGAGAMVSTLADLETWALALGDGRLIGPELQKVRVEQSRPVTNGPEYDSYGLGLGILKGWWGHTGTGVGWQVATFFDPRTGATISVMVNATPSGDRRNLNLAQELFEALAGVVGRR
jgi:D-alanyl-D-alanine carboxypeptidase